jgi:hypothetical protein
MLEQSLSISPAFIGLSIYRADRFCKYIIVQQKYKTMVNLVAMAANSLVKCFQFRSTLVIEVCIELGGVF